ncbi:MAG: YHS domain-containing protein [Firmicutes bacterium]|nr:YHS domain-containing protein [Bacillota bacterium]
MEVSEGICSVYRGEIYCFCSSACKAEFARNPEAYVAEDSRQESSSESGGSEKDHGHSC